MMAEKTMTGTEVRELRTRRGWSQEDLAAALGVRAQTVSRWEREINEIGQPEALAIFLRATSRPFVTRRLGVPHTPELGRIRCLTRLTCGIIPTRFPTRV